MQKIKIVKDILVEEDGKYGDNTFADSGHEDYFTQNGGGIEDTASYRPNFRFKIYLRSNLEQLYRTEDGEVEWLDRNGNTVDIAAYRAAYPNLVQKIYTKVLHRTDFRSRRSNRDVIANQELYSFTDGRINEYPETGYTAVLETILSHEVDADGDDKEISRYNYQKFFDAVGVANQDKWDKAKPEYTSFKPLAFIRQLLFGTAGSEDVYKRQVYVNGTIGGYHSTAIGGVTGKYVSGKLKVARFEGTIGNSQLGAMAREGAFIGTRHGAATNFNYIDDVAYLFTDRESKISANVCGSEIADDNDYTYRSEERRVGKEC